MHLSALGCRHGTLYGNMLLSANSTRILLVVSPRLLSLLLIFMSGVQVCHHYPGVLSGHPKPQWDHGKSLGLPPSKTMHHSPTVLPIPKCQGDHGKSQGFPCPTKATIVHLSFPSQSPKGSKGSPWDSHVPARPPQSHCPSHPKVQRGPWEVLGIPMSHQGHHSPTVLPIPRSGSPRDCPRTPHHSWGLGIVLWGVALVLANLDMSVLSM